MSPRDLWVALSVEPGSYHRFQFRTSRQVRDREDVDEWGTAYIPVERWDSPRFDRMRDTFVDLAGSMGGELEDVTVSLVARRRPSELHGLARSGAMWCRLETQRQLQALRAFRPVPSLVVREGESLRRWAVWLVDPHLMVAQLDRGNKRVAHRVGAKKKWGRVDVLMPAPGTIMRWGRERRPALVRVEHWSGDVFTPGDVAGRLPDAPEPWHPDRAAA